MTKADFSIVVDPQQSLVRITLAGFFEADEIARFTQARNTAHRQLLSAPNQHVTLVDIRDMQIQAQDSVAAFQRVLADPASQSRRIAFVVARSLARLQAQRAAADRGAAYFADVAEAERWLLDESAAAA
ncbi:conserved hypothetical protein [Sphingomonas sp. EC-HK361]|uniref:hypothetical protein n=1 Tax=Sphingomonas sp. EC-HK361 TaxID=2038397 RepID=UPI0012599116|nr:hypothetical protein [Sphingomonas sp. EC-HK361]VVT13045.1 conserved hypothetical protein [Sphingomonas sp. EC-HK361]